MTTKQRNKNNSHLNDKKTANSQDDVAKKSPKLSRAENASSPNSGSGSRALMKFLSALFYLALLTAAAIAAFYFQQLLSEVRHMNITNEESIKKWIEATTKAERALQQISSVKATLEGLETEVGSAKTDLEIMNRAVQKRDIETHQMEEGLQNLQKKILLDLTEGIQEVKNARENDISSLERTLEERLAKINRIIAESVAEFDKEQRQYKSELTELKSHLGEQGNPAFLKQELSSINSAVANLNTANEVADGNMEVLREQIESVRGELQTRNKEVVSVSGEIEVVRSLVQTTIGALREEVSTARASVLAMSDQVQSVNDRQERSSEALQSLETEMREKLLKVEKRGDDVGVRLKATEENEESLASSLLEQTNRLEGFISKHESQKHSLNTQCTAVERETQALREELEGLKISLTELQKTAAALDDAKRRLLTVEQRLNGHETEGLEDLQELESTIDLDEQLDEDEEA